MSFEKLTEHRRIWERKVFLRKVYQEAFFTRLRQHCAPGARILEVGGGPGFYKTFDPSVISSDIVPCPWHDLAFDAQCLPIRDACLDNVVGLDFLHHVNDPIGFLLEVSRTLRPGGRLVLIEPWLTPFSYLINKFCMPEDCDLSWRPGVSLPALKTKKQPFDGNSAIPYMIFARHASAMSRLAPGLRLLCIEPFAFLSYLCSLGFRDFSLVPGWLYAPLQAVETATISMWRRTFALKALIAMEKR